MCPQTNLYTVLTRIIAKALEVIYITIKSRSLPISSSVSIVRKNPTQWHIVFLISIDNGTSRELIVLLFAIKAFLDTAIVLLTFYISLAVFKKDSLAFFGCLLPIVAVVGIEVALIESKLWQQDGVTGQLIIILKQRNWGCIDH